MFSLLQLEKLWPTTYKNWQSGHIGRRQPDTVTRLGELLQLGQLFEACGNIYFAQITHIFRQFL